MAVWLQAILTLAPNAQCRQLAEWLARDGRTVLDGSGGSLWGLWHGCDGGGLAADEAMLMSVWPDDGSAGSAVELMKALPQVIGVTGTPLHPALRPQSAHAVSGSGIWLFRDLLLPTTSIDDFLDCFAADSTASPAASESEIMGLFRGPNEDVDTASLLLITRHADLEAAAAAQDENAYSNALRQRGDLPSPPRWTRARSATLQAIPGSR